MMEDRCYTAKEVRGIFDSKQRIFDMKEEAIEERDTARAAFKNVLKVLDKETAKVVALETELADICTQLHGIPGSDGSRLDGEGGLAAATMLANAWYERENAALLEKFGKEMDRHMKAAQALAELRKAVEEAVGIILACAKEMEGLDDTVCDHSVGICWCEWHRIINNAKQTASNMERKAGKGK